MLTKTIATFDQGGCAVAWAINYHNDGSLSHSILYGKQETIFRDDLSACHNYGECVRHSLECAGKLDRE